MSYRVAGIDVHKRMLAVVITDVEVDGAYQFTRRKVGTSPHELRELAAWLVAEAVEEVVMESTAQYWRPVWETLERAWTPARRTRDGARPLAGTLHLAQAQSNRGPRGRKQDFPDAERLVKRLVAQELILSFVPEPTQRLWRTVMRRKYQLTRSRVQLQNRLECLLEGAHLKLSRLVSDLLSLSARRMLQAVADGETSPTALAALADRRLRATPEQLGDALGACTDLEPTHRVDLRRPVDLRPSGVRRTPGLPRVGTGAVQRLRATARAAGRSVPPRTRCWSATSAGCSKPHRFMAKGTGKRGRSCGSRGSAPRRNGCDG